MKLLIKNMVCPRCIHAVADGLSKLGYSVDHIELGMVMIGTDAPDLTKISQLLTDLGFELLASKEQALVERIKLFVINMVHQGNYKSLQTNFSVALSQAMGKDYPSLSTLFSQVEGITLEKYFISQRIEKAKELLMYDELNTSQIAHELGFSHIGHFSSQFRQHTGFSPTQFRKNTPSKSRRSIDQPVK